MKPSPLEITLGHSSFAGRFLKVFVTVVGMAGQAQTGLAFDLRVVDVQAAIERLPEANILREKLSQARTQAQERVNKARSSLVVQRKKLSEAEFSRATRRLMAQAEQEERRLDDLQVHLLKPLIARIEAVMRAAVAPDRKVVRADEVPLIGWSRSCSLTHWVLTPNPRSRISLNEECEVDRFMIVDVDKLAVQSTLAQDAQRRVERFRRQQQHALDRLKARVEALERSAQSPSELALAQNERALLDQKVLALADSVRTKAREEEDQVYSTILNQLARAARTLAKTAVVEKNHKPPPGPSVDGQVWAEGVLRP